MISFNEYQRRASRTAIYPGRGTTTGLLYVGLGLGEAGEIQGKIKKVLRDADGILDIEAADAIAKEAGDLLWYLAQLASELDMSLGDIADANLAKLADRASRNVLTGNGDNR